MITASDLIVPSTFFGDETAPFFGFLGATAALVFSCMGAVYGTPKRGVGVASMGVMRFELLMTSNSGDEVDLRSDGKAKEKILCSVIGGFGVDSATLSLKDLFETKAKGRSDGKAKEKILVLIPETTFVGVESRVLIPETTFVGVESRVLIPETTVWDTLVYPSDTLVILATVSMDPVKEWILTEGKATQITGISPVGGGCINLASRYNTDAGTFFVKTNRSIGPEMFEGEELGLNAMYETKSIRVPKPYKVGALPTGGSYIIMEFIEFGSSRGDQAILGRKLAEMHKAAKSEKGFGFHVNNTIGSTPQINTWTSDWIEFYSEHRLTFQLKLAQQQFGDSAIYEKGQRLVKNIGALFEGVTIEPCLLHGDLWSGNISSDKNGEPVILDPACYYGHNEAEFGMSWCAGFGWSFYKAYFEVMPQQPGFEKRRDLYLLYHYLNHYNLFGSGYRSSAMSIIDDYLRVLKA
ncbi:protein-ribulosamine 3-kinase, chloroplastic [Tanacetum coccineum]